ncbi:peptidoglycan-binding protein [Methylorubrum podarium]|uniref:Peptidoglycan-binding protein n=1 Tax=Methylorubrum podarium TaxID=200476 RepID=A0ABV1QJI0_9HYPH
MSIPAPARRLLDFIGSKEAPRGYDTVFGNRMAQMPKPLTTMTVDEVIAQGKWRTDSFGSSAAGRYQFMRNTLASLKQTERLTGREVMTPALQDRLGYALLLRRGYAKFMAGQLSVIGFGLGLAQEWASFPVLAATKGAHRQVQRGQTYYLGDGLNKVLATAGEVEAVLNQMRAMPAVAVADALVVTVPAPTLPQVRDLVVPDESGLSRWLPWLLKKKPKAVAAKGRPGLHRNGSPELWDVQDALRERAYYTKGTRDGLDGPLTQEAVAQARKDNGLGDGGIDAAFLAALPAMPHRPVAAERAKISLGKAAQHAPELFGPAKWLGTFGAGLLGLGGADGAGLLDNVQGTFVRINDTADKVQTGLGYVTSIVGFLVEHKMLVFIALGLFLVVKAAGYVLDGWIKVRTAFF